MYKCQQLIKKKYFLIVSGKAKNMGENQPKTFQKNCFFQPLYSLAAFDPDPNSARPY